MTADTNSGALDAALDTAITYADLAPSDSVKLYASGEDSKMFMNVVDKSFSAKSSTLTKYVTSLYEACALPYSPSILCPHL